MTNSLFNRTARIFAVFIYLIIFSNQLHEVNWLKGKDAAKIASIDVPLQSLSKGMGHRFVNGSLFQNESNAVKKNHIAAFNVDSLKNSSWFAKITKKVEAEEYEITMDQKSHRYVSPNRKNHLVFTYSENGFSVKPLITEIAAFNTRKNALKKNEQPENRDQWNINLSLSGYGREGAVIPFHGRGLTATKRNASNTDGNLFIQYNNSEEGMRQDFVVSEKLAGIGNLKLRLRVNTTLRFNASENGLAFHDAKNDIKMYYNGLKIYDANGNDVKGTIEKLNDTTAELCVNDNAVAYPITIDPLSNSASWTKSGESSGNQFGFSVATAGDVNGDGYSDVIVGAPFYSTSKGKVYVYYGSSTGLSTTASWTQTGENNNDQFGHSVATSGDVNGDGYSDVIVGASNYTSSSTSQGKAYAYYGSSTGLEATASWTVIGTQGGNYFGASVATAGDVNGDGYSDVIVGANGYSSFTGKAYVYNGSSSGVSTTASWTQTGENSGDSYGSSLGTAGDVNGDGFSDIIVGAYYYSSLKGKAYVYHGSSSGLSNTASWTKTGESNYHNFAVTVSTAGDVNGDGYSDVIIGAPGYTSANGIGKAYVFNGSSTGLSTTASWTKLGEATYDNFGTVVATAGDINGDGYSDVLVGVPSSPYPSSNGKAYVFNGSSTGLSSTALWTKSGENSSDSFGLSVALAGDVNGDGYSDVIVGAPNYSSGTGKVYLFNGNSTGLSTTALWTQVGENAFDNFGYSVSTAGDINGDGYSDIIVGAVGFSSVTGKAYVYNGSSTGLSATASWTVLGENTYDNFAYSVSNAGDVNGDGYSDVIIGSVNFPYPSGKGKAYVYNGGSTGLSGTASWTQIGENNGDSFGWSVATAGDINGDGFNDIIVGAYGYSTFTGKAYVFNGSSTGVSATASWTKTGESSNDYFGYSVATAGDVNGDGCSDVLVGAYGYSASTGKAYLYNGSSTGLSTTASWTKTGENSGDEFGSSLSTAGDVNGDGYSDIIIGAYWYSSRTGKVYVYNGNASGSDTSASWTYIGENSLDYFGKSVAAVGDVNGDGYSDVIVGAQGYPSINSYGKAYVYYGNAGGGLKTFVQQYQPSSSTVIGPDGSTTTDGSVRLSAYVKSPFGRTKGKLVYEYVAAGTPFSGQFSTSSSGSQNSFTDLDTSSKQLNADVGSIPTNASYNWRARTQYDLASNPFQKFSPWKYYTSYQPLSFGSFKSQTTPLPVELISFAVSIEQNNVQLKWTTATEINNYGFEIEMKKIKDELGSMKWEKIGFMEGKGTSNTPKEYSYSDKNLNAGKYSYRLKQIDRNGNFSYSQIAEVTVSNLPKEFSLEQNYPNPFNPTTTISYHLSANSFATLKVYDAIGREVAVLVNEVKEAGSYSVHFNASHLSSGIYFARLQSENKVQLRKMLLLK